MIKSIKISNYKNLDGFEFDGFGRLNLITGKNNVGKTNLLEAIYLGDYPSSKAILTILLSRMYIGNMSKQQIENLFKDLNLNNKISIMINNNSIEIEVNETFLSKNMNKLDLNFNISKTDFIVSLKQNSNEITTLILSEDKISNKDNKSIKETSIYMPIWMRTPIEELSQNLSDIIRKLNKKDLVLNILQLIDKKIDNIQIFTDNNKPNIYISINGKDLPLSSFGDATNKLLRIFINIILNNDNIILIDEVENGIYYENQKIFWSQLLKISKLTNCQIIATTHSLEMINSFYEVTKEENDCKLLKLVRNIDNEIVIREMEKELIEYILEDKHLNESDVLR